jgi:Amt family ammonium transporter
VLGRGDWGPQLIALAAVGVFTVVMTFVIARIVMLFTPLRVTPEEEVEGLDYAAHGERAYDFT